MWLLTPGALALLAAAPLASSAECILNFQPSLDEYYTDFTGNLDGKLREVCVSGKKRVGRDGMPVSQRQNKHTCAGVVQQNVRSCNCAQFSHI